jgi:DNA-binding MarR family transcriptional regulator
MNIEQVLQTEVVLPMPKKTVLNILYAQHFVSDRLSEICKAHDLSVEQYNVLRILRGQKGLPTNMQNIQGRMIARTSNTTRLVDKLVAKKWVNRELCLHNRRKMDVLITEEGLAVLAALDPLIDEIERRLAANLTTMELKQLNILLEKYRTIVT